MQSVSTIGKRVSLVFVLSLSIISSTFSQDNSPWSRYGLGDIVPTGNVANRGMGHIGAAYNDFQTINFINPASYRRFGLQRSILDIGIDVNSRKLSNNKGNSYTSNNAYIPYLAAGFQVKPTKSKVDWGVAFGLRPATKVSYNIQSGGRMPSGDSTVTLYEGTGGSYQAFLGTAIGIKNFSIGVNGGYRFGTADYTTRVNIFNDTAIGRYRSGQKKIRNRFGAPFAEVGVQYMIKLKVDTANKKTSLLHLGAYTSLESNMRGTRDELFETFLIDQSSGSDTQLDSVSEVSNIPTRILYPSTYGFGFMYEHEGNSSLRIGADYVMSKWGNYRYDGNKDNLQDGWQVKLGGQIIPDITGRSKSYWSQVMYRAGFNYGLEPYTIDGNMKSYGITFGAGFPIKRFTYQEINKSNIVNTAFEFGQRGNRTALLRENYFRFTIGFSLSDIWFIKRKYD
nr:hypothetical protein [uncultured Lacibacter sp.]